MTETSQTVGALAGALAKAQAEIEGAAKDRVNPHFKSSYATLASVWDACRPALSKHGIAVVQSPSSDGSVVTVYTTLLHASGEWMRSALSASARDGSPQSIGSALTYLRRYSLASMVGVAPEDDDGNDAQPRFDRPSPPLHQQQQNMARPPQQPQQPQRAAPPPEPHPVVEAAKEVFPGSTEHKPDDFELIRADLLQVWPNEEGEDREQRLGFWWAQLKPSKTAKMPDDWSPAKAFRAAPAAQQKVIKATAARLAGGAGSDDE